MDEIRTHANTNLPMDITYTVIYTKVGLRTYVKHEFRNQDVFYYFVEAKKTAMIN